MSNPFNQQYQNSKNGVQLFAKDGIGIELNTIKSIDQDPSTPGVWGIELIDDPTSTKSTPSIVVYLGGHSTNAHNDFECNEYTELNLL